MTSRRGRAIRSGIVLLAATALGIGIGAVATRSADDPSTTPANNSAEAGFVRDMSTHHAQAVSMADAIRSRTQDPLLAALASSPIPIDVREVRINADAMPGGDRRGMPTMTADPSDTDKALRSHDIRVELRGTVGLAARPSEQALGAAPAAEEGS